MNTADASGDAIFDLMGIMVCCPDNLTRENSHDSQLPEMCANQSHGRHSGFCDNPEERADDLVVTRVVVEVDNRWAEFNSYVSNAYSKILKVSEIMDDVISA